MLKKRNYMRKEMNNQRSLFNEENLLSIDKKRKTTPYVPALY